jgi:biotin synthase-related radical SAM superfamily protein
MVMSADAAEQPLAPELEAVATAAERQLRTLASEEPANGDHLGQALADAATAAIASGHPIAAVADTEQRGQQRARAALSRELLTRVERSARRRREAEHNLHQAIARAARLGLAHRDIATAAQVAHGTIRAILTRANGDTTPAPPEPEETPPASQGTDTPLPS